MDRTIFGMQHGTACVSRFELNLKMYHTAACTGILVGTYYYRFVWLVKYFGSSYLVAEVVVWIGADFLLWTDFTTNRMIPTEDRVFYPWRSLFQCGTLLYPFLLLHWMGGYDLNLDLAKLLLLHWAVKTPILHALEKQSDEEAKPAKRLIVAFIAPMFLTVVAMAKLINAPV